MISTKILQLTLSVVVLFSIQFTYAASLQEPLNLSEAEYLAIANSPELKQLQAIVNSLNAQAIADGQLSDPQIIVGVYNLPTNSFSFTQDDMTMLQVGLHQAFAPGHSLKMQSNKTKSFGKAEEYKIQVQTAMLLRNVREIWLDLFYLNQSSEIIRNNQSLYQQLLKVNMFEYSTGRRTQSDVLQVRVELSRLNDQIVQIDQRMDILRAQLGRWIGENHANRTISSLGPRWLDPPTANILQSRLFQHPLLKVDMATIEASRHEVAFAKEKYKPGWMLDVNYAVRQGRMADGQQRSNFVGAQVSVDLPFFTGNRQDKRLRASAQQLVASELDRVAHYKDLRKELTVQYAVWQSLSKRENIYRQHIHPEAKQNSKAALLAYKNTTLDLSTVLRAYSNELTIQLEEIQIQADRAKARTALLYLEGITQ